MTHEEIIQELNAYKALIFNHTKTLGLGDLPLKIRPWRGRTHDDWTYHSAPELFDEYMTWLQDHDYFQHVEVTWHQSTYKAILTIRFTDKKAAMHYKLTWGSGDK